MGTRSLTFVYEGNVGSEPIMNMYRQYDGYVSGHGRELAEFLASIKLVNGFGLDDHELGQIANGMGCLSAQLIVFFKKSVGGFYIHPVTSTDCHQDYEYHVYQNRVIVKDPCEVIFDGSWEEFYDFCYDEETA